MGRAIAAREGFSIDHRLVAIYLSLVGLGLVLFYSSGISAHGSFMAFMPKKLLHVLAGLAAFTIAARIPYTLYQRYRGVVLLVSVVLLILPLIPGLGILRYKDGPIVTMNCIAPGGSSSFHWSAVGANGIVDWTHGKDPSPYLKGAKTFTRMFKTGKEPIEHRRMLAPVAVLAALQKSLDQGGKRVKVAKF